MPAAHPSTVDYLDATPYIGVRMSAELRRARQVPRRMRRNRSDVPAPLHLKPVVSPEPHDVEVDVAPGVVGDDRVVLADDSSTVAYLPEAPEVIPERHDLAEVPVRGTA